VPRNPSHVNAGRRRAAGALIAAHHDFVFATQGGLRVAPNPGRTARKSADAKAQFPPGQSSGYLVRDAHRAFQRLLEKRIAPYGVTRGQWYFLRVLWTEDGLSQRELSARVGMMEPTTVIALRSMEKSGLIRRVRSSDDKRRSQVWLTAKAQRMRNELLAVARGITDEAEAGIARGELAAFRRVIAQMTANLDRIRR
jgi:DNA-binding MarR family transcriptional regulator